MQNVGLNDMDVCASGSGWSEMSRSQRIAMKRQLNKLGRRAIKSAESHSDDAELKKLREIIARLNTSIKNPRYGISRSEIGFTRPPE